MKPLSIIAGLIFLLVAGSYSCNTLPSAEQYIPNHKNDYVPAAPEAVTDELTVKVYSEVTLTGTVN